MPAEPFYFRAISLVWRNPFSQTNTHMLANKTQQLDQESCADTRLPYGENEKMNCQHGRNSANAHLDSVSLLGNSINISRRTSRQIPRVDKSGILPAEQAVGECSTACVRHVHTSSHGTEKGFSHLMPLLNLC